MAMAFAKTRYAEGRIAWIRGNGVKNFMVMVEIEMG